MKKLYRSEKDRKIAGVCGGIGEYFGIDPTVVRIIFVLLLLPGGLPGLIPYLLLWLLVPNESELKQPSAPDKEPRKIAKD